jgi:hypothetical protein
LPDSKYYQSFKDKIETADWLGAAIGEKPDLIAAKLATITAVPDAPTDAERATTVSVVKDAYLAHLFLINSDKKWYAALMHDIENDFTRGNDTYPDTLSSAYDFIINYVAPRTTSRHPDDGGMAYAQEDDDAVGEQGQQDSRPNQQGGRGGQGGGGGRGNGMAMAVVVKDLLMADIMADVDVAVTTTISSDPNLRKAMPTTRMAEMTTVMPSFFWIT